MEDGRVDLRALPQESWHAALRATTSSWRREAVASLPRAQRNAGYAILSDVECEQAQRQRAVRVAAANRRPIPRVPGAAPPSPRNRTPRQVSFRLSDLDHASLTDAAQVLHLSPAATARLLAMRGVDAILRAERGA